MAQVFLSYQKQDRELAKRVVKALGRHGITTWWDDALSPKESWDRTIEREIAAARHVLVLWTNNSIESDWVRIEATYGKTSRPSKLVQARFDQCAVPMAFTMIQHVDLDRRNPAKGQGWDKIIRWLNEGDAPDDVQLPGETPRGNETIDPVSENRELQRSATGRKWNNSFYMVFCWLVISYLLISAYGSAAIAFYQFYIPASLKIMCILSAALGVLTSISLALRRKVSRMMIVLWAIAQMLSSTLAIYSWRSTIEMFGDRTSAADLLPLGVQLGISGMCIWFVFAANKAGWLR